MFTGKKARKQLSFWVTLALSAGGAYLPTGTGEALWEAPLAHAADVTVGVSEDQAGDNET